MGDLSKLKVAVAQPDLTQTDAAAGARAQERMVERALDIGADVLVLPGSLVDASDIRLIALNDTRIDIAGSRVLLEAAGESYIVSLGREDAACDFSVLVDLTPWTLEQSEHLVRPGIVLRPVGSLNEGAKVCAFDGATCIYAADGTLVCRLRDDFTEDFTVVVLGRHGSVAGFCENKLLTCLEKTLQRFDRQVLEQSSPWVIGLSGGLDSAVSAALLVRAFGAERVRAYNLSSAHNTAMTRENARAVANALGIELRSGSIEGLVDATAAAADALGFGVGGGAGAGASADGVGGTAGAARAATGAAGAATGATGAAGETGAAPDLGSATFSGVVAHNVQARVRGHLLATLAALHGGVVVNNANRVEAALGYFTLYGDSIGAIAPLGDLTKVRLFDLALTINDVFGAEVVPQNLIPHETVAGYTWQTMPSAELEDDQRDPMKWFYHDWLIEQLLDAPSLNEGLCSVLEGYLSGALNAAPVGKWLRFYGLDNPTTFLEDLDWVLAQMQRSAFKRVQAPPTVKVASLASVYSHPVVQGPLPLSDRAAVLRRALERG